MKVTIPGTNGIHMHVSPNLAYTKLSFFTMCLKVHFKKVRLKGATV